MKTKLVDKSQIVRVSVGMAEMAANYHNTIIANALSRVSYKLETIGSLFATPLTEIDKDVIRFYHQHKPSIAY